MAKYLKENVSWTLETFANTGKMEWGYQGEVYVDYLTTLYERVKQGDSIPGVNKKKYLRIIKKAIRISEKFHTNYQLNMQKFWKMCKNKVDESADTHVII